MMRQFSALLLVFGLLVLMLGTASAGVVTTSQTAPIVDEDDIAMLVTAGAWDPGGDESHVWHDRPFQGQSFTTGPAAGGYMLSAVTVQNRGNNTGGVDMNVEIGSIVGNVFTSVRLEPDANFTIANWDYVTYTLDTPVLVTGNTLYGFQVGVAGNGFRLNSNDNGLYTGGEGYSTGDNKIPDYNNLLWRGVDRIFHVDLEMAFFIDSALVWDDCTGIWGDQAAHGPSTSHWTGGATADEIPTIALDGASGDSATIGGGAVTVAADQGAGSLDVTGGSLTINADKTLTVMLGTTVALPGTIAINGTLDTGSFNTDGATTLPALGTLKTGDGTFGGTTNLGAGATLVAGDATFAGVTTLGAGALLDVGSGTMAGITTTANATFAGGGSTTNLVLAAASTFTKDDPGTLTVTDPTTNVIVGSNTIRVAGGELAVQAADATTNPLGGAALVLDGGTFTAIGSETASPGLRHYGYHINNDGLAMDLNNNAGMMGGGDPTTFNNFFGEAILTDGPGNRGLDFNNDGDFTNTGAVGQANNYSNLFVGYLNVDAANVGNWELKRQQDDDRMGIWLDLDQDGVFESSQSGLGSNRGEQLQWDNDGGTKTVTLAEGRYLFAATHREGGGGSGIEVRVKSPTMGGQTSIKPMHADQAGYWTHLSLGDVDMSSSAITLNETATLNAMAPNAAFGPLTYAADGKTLSVGGVTGNLTFEGVTLTGMTSAGLNTNAATTLGTVTGGAGVAMAKGGSGALTFDGDTGTTNPMGGMLISLNAGSLNLTNATATDDIAYTALAVGGDSTLSLGQHGVGRPGPQVVTVPSLTLKSGNVEILQNDGYTFATPAIVGEGGAMTYTQTEQTASEIWLSGALRNDYFPGRNPSYEDLLGVDDGIDANDTDGIVNGDSNASVFDLTPADDAGRPAAIKGLTKWSQDVYWETSIANNYTMTWTGKYTAPETGTYEVMQSSDDHDVMWIDLNQNFDYEASNGENVGFNVPPEGWNTAHTESFDLVGGETYDVAFMFAEIGGGDYYRMTLKTPSGGHQRVNPATAPGQWQGWVIARASIDWTSVPVNLTGGTTTLNMITDQSAMLGPLSFDAADVGIGAAGAPMGLTFTQTTFNHPNARVTPNVEIGLGTLINDTDVTVTTDPAAGLLAFDGNTNPMGALSFKLAGSGLGLTDATVADGVAFDPVVEVTADSRIFAGKYLGGQHGPQTVTLGGANTVTLTSGLLTLGTRDRYTLNVADNTLVANGGDLSFAPGASVNIGAGNEAKDLYVLGGTSGVSGLPGLALSGSIKIRPSAGNPVIDYTYDTGVNDVEIGDNDNYEGEAILSGMTAAASGDLRIVRGATNVPAAADLTAGNVKFDQNNRDQIAVLQTSGTFARDIGTAAGEVQWTQNGGFAAQGGPLTVTLNAGAPVLWADNTGLGGFNNRVLQFGSRTADNVTTLTNDIDLTNDNRWIQVADNVDTAADKLVLAGNISGTGNTDINKFLRFNENTGNSYHGTVAGNWRFTRVPLVELTGINTFTQRILLDQGAIFGIDGVGIPTASKMHFDANNWETEAVWLSNGTITRDLGDGAGQVKFDNNGGGFAAYGGPLTINLGGGLDPPADLHWNGATGFNGKRVTFGSRYATGVTTVANKIIADGGDRYTLIGNNLDTPDDYVVFEGGIDSQGKRMDFYYRGTDYAIGAGRFDFGTEASPSEFLGGGGIRGYDGVDMRYYQDLSVNNLDFWGGSDAHIMGSVTSTGVVKVRHGGTMVIDGDVSWGNYMESRSRDQATNTVGSTMIIHGNATSANKRVYINENSSILIDGELNTGTAKVEVRGGGLLDIGINPPVAGQDDLTIGDVLEVHNGSHVNVPGDFTNANRIYMVHSDNGGSWIHVGGNYAGKELRMYHQFVEMTVAGDATFNGRIHMGDGHNNTVGPNGPLGESGPYLKVTGVLTKTDMGQDFELYWGAEVKAMTPGSSIEARHFLVRDMAEAVINGPVTHNGRFDAISNGGGHVVIMGDYTKTDLGQRFYAHNGATVEFQAGGSAEASEMQIRHGSTADLGTVDVTLRDRIYMNEAGSYLNMGGDLTINHATNADAIEQWNGVMNIEGAVTAFRARIEGGTFQPNSTVTLTDELFVNGGGTFSAGSGVGGVTIAATQLNLMNDSAYLWELGPGGAAAGAGLGYDTTTLALDTKLTAEGLFEVVVAADGNAHAVPADKFTLLSYDLATVDPTNVPDGSLAGAVTVSLAPDAPVWWDVSGAAVSHDAAAGKIELTGLFTPGATFSNVAAGAWSATGSWDPEEVPGATRVGVVRDTHTITVGSAVADTPYVGVESGGSLVVASGGQLGNPSIDTINVDAGGSLTAQSGGTLNAEVVNSAGATVLQASSVSTIETLNATAGSVAADGASIGILKIRNGVAASATDVSITDNLNVAGNPRISVAPGGSFKIDGSDLANPAVSRTVTLLGDVVSIGSAAPPSLQSFFNFESKAGTTVEDQVSGSTHDGTLIAGADISTGGLGYDGGEALQLTTEGDYMDIGDPTAYDFHEAYTWTAQIKTTDGSGAVFSRNPDAAAWNQGSQALFVRGNNAQFDAGWVGAPGTGTAVQDDAWHQLVVTFDPTGDDFKIYVDGEVKYPGPFNANAYDEATHDHNGFANTSFTVGKADFTGGLNDLGTLIGLIDDVAIFNEALTGDTLTQLLTEGAPSLASGPVEMATTNFDVTADSTLNLGSSESAHFGQVNLGGNKLTIIADDPTATTLEVLTGVGTIDAAGGAAAKSLNPGGGGIGTITVAPGSDLMLDTGGAFNAQVSLASLTADKIVVSKVDPLEGSLDLSDGSLAPTASGRTDSAGFTQTTLLTVIDNSAGGIYVGGGVTPAPGPGASAHIGQGAFLRDVVTVGTVPITEVQLKLVVALEGDTDGDGLIGLDDWDSFRANFGSSAADWTEGNFDSWSDDMVDLDDWDIFRSRFGQTYPIDAAAGAAAAVPEPGTIVMLLGALAGLALLGWRRRRA